MGSNAAIASMMPTIVEARNDLLFAADGRVFIDAFCGHGAVLLGHGHPAITAALTSQVEKGWLFGALDSPARQAATARLDALLGEPYGLGGLYSTGMEAAEFALRVAQSHTGRPAALGFDGSMHGKSLATALLGWPKDFAAAQSLIRRLPGDEASALAACAEALKSGRVGAVFVEPIQASNGGRVPSDGFLVEVGALARRYGALLICDEILTGFHRTGPLFRFQAVGLQPDVVLFGKACANGFPASGVLLRRDIPIRPAMLPGSTFAGNPLAATVVAATLDVMASLDLPGRMAAIGDTIARSLAPLASLGAQVRGLGGLWVIEFPEAESLLPLVTAIYTQGVAVGFHGRQLRLLPPATITDEHLATVCGAILTAARA
jgi:acetylornithine/succinyldiaminopimelate/putrescine aminotransferase